MVGSYKILIGGSEVDLWESIDFQNSLDLNVNQAQIQFPDSDTLASAEGIGADIQIQRDSAAIWRGLGVSNQKTYDSQDRKQYVLNCLSNKIYLQKEIFIKNGSYVMTYGEADAETSAYTPISTAAPSILADILNSQGAGQGPNNLSQGSVGSSTNAPHAALVITRQTALNVLSQLIAGTLWEARFNPNNTVDFGSNSNGTVGSESSVFTFQEGENIQQAEVDYGIDKLVNQVIVCGAGSQANQIANATAQDSSSIASNGVWSKILNLSNCSDQTLLQAYANALLDDLSEPVYTMNAEIVDFSTGVPFQMGDLVTVNEESFGLTSAQFRVISEKRHYDGQNGEDVNVVLAQNYRMVNAAHFKRLQLEAILNSQLQNQQVFNNTFNQSPTANPQYIMAPGNTTSGLGGELEVDTYASISVSGISNGGTYYIEFSYSGTLDTVNALEIIDTYNNETIYSVSSPAENIPYKQSDSADRYDHLIKFHAVVTFENNNPSGVELAAGYGFPNLPSGCGIILNPPTPPT